MMTQLEKAVVLSASLTVCEVRQQSGQHCPDSKPSPPVTDHFVLLLSSQLLGWRGSCPLIQEGMVGGNEFIFFSPEVEK